MSYASVSELPASVRAKLKGKKLRQWMHVWNSSYKEHQSESIAFASAWAAVHKGESGFSKGTNAVTDFHVFLPIAKVDRERRIVSGYASTPTKDSDGEIVSLDAIKMALPGYLEYGNIREMHALKAVGVAAETNLDKKGLYLSAYISDDQAWKKCLPTKLEDGTELPPTYKGFSIGGRKLDKEGDTITQIELSEISVVDRPANPDCRIEIAKRAKEAEGAGGYLIKVKKLSPEKKALAKMAKIIETLAKEGPPAAHDGFSLPAPKAKENDSPKDPSVENNKGSDASVPCEAHGKIGCKECMEKREFDQAKRTELASSGKALPDGSFPIENEKDLHNAIRLYGHAKNPAEAKTHIKTRARAIGAEGALPEEWGKPKKGKSAKKMAKAELEIAFGLNTPSFLTLGKSMRTVGSLSYAFDSLRDAQRSLMLEGQREGGDKKDKGLASKLGSVAKDLAEVIGQKASHEGEEALSLTDADDSYLNSILGESSMDKVENVSTGDPILDAINNLVKRAAMPTRKAVMDSAKEDCSKSRKAMKECRKAIEEVHKMLKADYITKMEKAKKGDKEPTDGFDSAGAMSKLQEAFGKAEEARTFGKAAIAKMEKAESIPGRSGQRGQEAGDAEPGFYEVPPGVKDLTPAAMSGASPGGRESGGQPPMYPGDGSVFPGKAEGAFDLRKYADKDGRVPAHIAELVLQGAKNEGELEALRNISRTQLTGGRRPVAFDMTKAFGGAEGTQSRNPAELNKALFEGVDASAIGSGDENAHKTASARVIGNLLSQPNLFGKSILDPSFRGMAGQGRSSH